MCRNHLAVWGAIASAIMAASAHAQGLERDAAASNPTVFVSHVEYKGKTALRVLDRPDIERLDDLVPLPVQNFKDGVIEVDVAGAPAAGAFDGARGFIGIAFRVQQDPRRYEAFYIRPTNGRVDDQLRRNHATQYVGMPDYPWQRLRAEHPGVYESYADMVPGEWIHLKIEVQGGKARLYVGNADQPALIVNKLLGPSDAGGVALWIGVGTDGHFNNVKVTKTE